MQETIKIKKPAKVQTLVNWFYGNYCVTKCHEDLDRQQDHYPKLQELAKRLEGTEMTHKDFLIMIRSDKTICDLSDEEWKKRKFSWRKTDCPICKGLGINF